MHLKKNGYIKLHHFNNNLGDNCGVPDFSYVPDFSRYCFPASFSSLTPPPPSPAHPLATSGSWFHPPSPPRRHEGFSHFRNSEIPLTTMKSYLYVKTCTFQQKWTKKKLHLFVNFDVKSCFLLQSVFPYLCVCAPKFPPAPCASLYPREVLLPPWGARVPRLGNTGLRVLTNGNPAAVWSMIIDQLMISSYIGQRSLPDWSCQLADLEWVCLLYAVISGTHVHVHPYPEAEYAYYICLL